MSFEALAWAIRQNIRAPEKSVLLMLAYRDNPDPPHGCYPSLDTLAANCGMDRSTVVRCVKVLLDKGFIKRQARFDDQGRQRSSFYWIPGIWGGADGTPRGANSTTGGCQQHLGRGAISTTEPKRENPNEEPKKALARAMRWPDGFVLTNELKAYAISKGILQPEIEWERFEENHRSKGSKFVDWPKAWHTWVLRSGDFRHGGNGNGTGKSNHIERTKRTLETAESLLARFDGGTDEIGPALPPRTH